MLELIKFLFGWADKSGGALLCGFALGALAMLFVRRTNHCYQQEWIEAYRKEAKLHKIIAKENEKCGRGAGQRE